MKSRAFYCSRGRKDDSVELVAAYAQLSRCCSSPGGTGVQEEEEGGGEEGVERGGGGVCSIMAWTLHDLI